MRVVVLQSRAPLGHLKIGTIVPEMPANVARTLIARGIVREEKAMESPVNRMMTVRKPKSAA